MKVGSLLICIPIIIAVDFLYMYTGDNEDSSGDKSEDDATHQGQLKFIVQTLLTLFT